MLPPLGGVTLYITLFESGLQAALTALDLRRRFFMVSLDAHPAVAGYVFQCAHEVYVDFHAGRFGGVFCRKRPA
jgi:hypothetical protein